MAAGWKQFEGGMNLIQIPPSTGPVRPGPPQHTSRETLALCPPLPTAPTSELHNMLSCHSRPPTQPPTRSHSPLHSRCLCLCALKTWCLKGKKCCGSQSSGGRRVTVNGAGGRLSFMVPETVLSQQTSPCCRRMRSRRVSAAVMMCCV